MPNRSWLADFEFSDGVVFVKKTGHKVPMRWSLIQDFLTWVSFFTLAQTWRIWWRLRGFKRPNVAFLPEKPRPWYFIWPVLQVSGAKIVDDPETADILFYFDDATFCNIHNPHMASGKRCINFDCKDISKSNIERIFTKVAGYGACIDPTNYNGPIVEKSEINGAHDGRIIEGPLSPVAGHVYMKVIDNEIDGARVEDLRTCIVGGKARMVFRKRRPLEHRFLNENTEILLVTPQSCFSNDELFVIEAFAEELGLDWGGIDVLRDQMSGKIYIIDANKTDMGPPIALDLGSKLKATRVMARAFLQAFGMDDIQTKLEK